MTDNYHIDDEVRKNRNQYSIEDDEQELANEMAPFVAEINKQTRFSKAYFSNVRRTLSARRYPLDKIKCKNYFEDHNNAYEAMLVFNDSNLVDKVKLFYKHRLQK